MRIKVPGQNRRALNLPWNSHVGAFTGLDVGPRPLPDYSGKGAGVGMDSALHFLRLRRLEVPRAGDHGCPTGAEGKSLRPRTHVSFCL